MGWSCTRAVGQTLDSLSERCRALTGSSNTWEVDGQSYFWELDSEEHDDCSATGQVMKMLPGGRCQVVSSFRIDPDGRIVRGLGAFHGIGDANRRAA